MIKYCAVALCALAAMLFMRSGKSDFAGFVGMAASVILLGAAVVTAAPVFEYVHGTVSGTVFETYLATLAKAIGITVSVQFVSEICRDAGENSLASKLELVGKAEILLLCLPLASELMGLAAEILEL